MRIETTRELPHRFTPRECRRVSVEFPLCARVQVLRFPLAEEVLPAVSQRRLSVAVGTITDDASKIGR